MQKFAEQLGFPEAPVPLPDGGFLFVEMDPAKGCITRFSRDGATRTVVARTGRPNGLALDPEGFVWVAETAMRALLRLPLSLLLTFVVPIVIATHVLMLARLARPAPAR